MALSVVRTVLLTTQQIQVLFTDALDTNIGVSNIVIESQLASVDNPTILSVEVDEDLLVVNYTPLFANVQYQISFISTSAQGFQTISGERIFESGNRNKFFFTSPGESQNNVRDGMLEVLPIVYESEEPSTIRNIISSIASEFGKGQQSVDTVRAGNYLSVAVENESIIRDDGPIDRFANGGTFDLLRVGSTPALPQLSGRIRFNAARAASFVTRNNTIVNSVVAALPADPISLQSLDIIEEEIGDNVNADNFFSGLRIKVANRPVIQVIAVTLKRDDDYIPYDIERFGYTLQSNRYDTRSASINVNLEDSEIDLSSSSLTGEDGGFLQPKPGDTLLVSYVYKKLGREPGSDSVSLSTIRESTRETTPAIITTFTLDHAPIVLANDKVPVSGGIEFLNTVVQNGNPPFTVPHPAFTTEVVYDIARPPVRPGEFSVNYETGEVLVFGSTIEGEGTGVNPPAAEYLYREVFIQNLDYTFEPDENEIAARSTRNIAGIEAKVSFDYEDLFAEGEDFRFVSHVESLDERINNNLVGDFAVRVDNFPITNVFRVFNETTGEVYNISRFNNSTVYFSGRQAPVQNEITRERIRFSRIPQEVLLLSDELSNSSSIRIFKIELANSSITDNQRRFIGSSFDTSVLFSDETIFQQERFYEDRLFTSVDTNIDRLESPGEYMIDYANGIVYVAVTTDQTNDLGDISYEYADVVTNRQHILRVNNIYRSANALEDNLINYRIGSITDTTANIRNLEAVGERFINDNPTRPILVGSYQSGEDGITSAGGSNFVSNSATFSASDVGRTLRLGAPNKPPSEDVTITDIISSKEVLVSPTFSFGGNGRVWNVLDLSAGAPKVISLGYNITAVQNIYLVDQLATTVTEDLDGYFDINRDSFTANRITLGDDNPLEVGDAVVVNYNYGEVYIDYRYLRDNILVSYEYGDNALDWSISNSLDTGEEYFVSYKYGALREPLLSNFGALTQIPLLTNFPADLDREVYRSVVGGTLQSFVEGPTIPSIERLVEAFTDVTPDITESAFDNWVLGRDFLYLRDITSKTTPLFDLGRFDNGVLVRDGQAIRVPAVSNFRLDEGTLETWVRPDWEGQANDAILTFDLVKDGYSNPNDVYIGFSAIHPETMPFSISTRDEDISVIGRPKNFDTAVGYFIWFDEFERKWNFRWKENREDFVDDCECGHEFSGTITTEGEFFNIVQPTSDDGYELNEVTDVITSRTNIIEFTASIDCREGPGGLGSIDGGLFTDPNFICNIDGGSFLDTIFIGFVDGGFYTDTEFTPPGPSMAEDGLEFASGKIHYIFDMAQRPDANRVSIFKDGVGYLNFQVYDNSATQHRPVGAYNLSTNVRNWRAGELHHIATTWKFNSADERDEMHLFIDGQEVPSLFKYGGNPAVSNDFTFGATAEETVISDSSRPIVGAFDGASETGSSLFRSVNTNFENEGVEVGDTLYILEDNIDGTLSSNGLGGGAYTITGVGGNTVTIDTSPASGLSLSIGKIQFSVNQSIETVSTPVNFQNFFVVDRDAYGNEVELNGLDTLEPDYSIARGASGRHILSINNGIPLGHNAVIKPLGLVFRRCRDRVFSYGHDNKLRFNGPPPVSLQDVDITSILLPKLLIADGYTWGSDFYPTSTGLVATLGGDGYALPTDGYLCQPSNQVTGRTLALTLNSENIDFGSTNTVLIRGETAPDSGGDVNFEVTYAFTDIGTIITDDLWKRIDTIKMHFTPIDISDTAGTIDIREHLPINEGEAGGDFAEVVAYDNGLFALEVYGSGGMPFILQQCDYLVDYPSFLKLRVDGQPDNFIIGADFAETNTADAVIDEFRVLREISTDTRVGETVAATERTITTDFVDTQPFDDTDDTVLLAHFDDNLDKSDRYIDAFDKGFRAAPSVNESFGRSLRVSQNGRPFELSNARGVFNNNEGTIEFWVSPLDDSRNDPNRHYYIDMSSVVIEEQTSNTRISVTTNQRIRTVDSVRLLSDTTNTGINYFTGGRVSNVDNRTITLGTPLPAQNVPVKVTFTPLNAQGDRVSIYKDEDGFVNFFMRASGVDHIISTRINWRRHTWHRVMAMWKANSANNQDRLRLFVDGFEKGTIKYGTGLLYGTGVIYGQEDVRPGAQRFIVTNIDLTDTFAKVVIGTDVFRAQNARARIDNIRFSEIQRLQTLNTVGGNVLDVNFKANTELAEPVFEDIFTTRLLDFDKEISDVEFLATLINSERGIFRFEVDVIDSFDRVIGDTRLEDLLVDLINTIKPAHTESIIRYVE